MPATSRYEVDAPADRSVGQNAMDKRLGIALFALQATFVVMFAIFARYDEAQAGRDPVAVAVVTVNGTAVEEAVEVEENIFGRRYPMFQDVHVMIFIGFGFLMTFLKKYGYSSVGFNLLLAALAAQWALICEAVLGLIERVATEGQDGLKGGFTLPISMDSLVNGDFAAAAVLISFGAVLGKTSPCQLLAMVLMEIPLYTLNFHIVAVAMGAADAGGSMVIHAFGAYFGLAVSVVLRRNWTGNDEDNASLYHSDLFAMIGTVFLWIYWPSFNGVLLASAVQQQRTVINTYFSLTACVLTAFGTSVLVHGKGKLDMVHVQNATLAGGVAVGTAANFVIQPFGAAVIGGLAGILSTLGYAYLSPFLQDKAGLHDTCGVHNLHGMPAILAGVAGIVGAFAASKDSYGPQGLMDTFPSAGTEDGSLNAEWTAGKQAIAQASGLGVSLIIAIVGGLLTGTLMRFCTFCGPVEEDLVFRDEAWWEVAEAADVKPPPYDDKAHDYEGQETRPPTAVTRPPTAHPSAGV